MSKMISGAYNTNHCSKKGFSKKGVWRKINEKQAYTDPKVHSLSIDEIAEMNKARGCG